MPRRTLEPLTDKSRKAKALLRKWAQAKPRQRVTPEQFDVWRVKYNEEVQNAQDATRRAAMDRKNQKAKEKRALAKEKREEQKNAQRTFIIHATLETTYDNNYYDNGMRFSAGTVVTSTVTSEPFTGIRSNMEAFVREQFDYQDSVKSIVVLNYSIEYMDTTLRNNRRATNRTLMRRAFVLKNDWLQYSHGIAELAYQDTGGKCVYAQLTQYLLKPPTGNPTKFISGRRTCEDALFYFFQEYINIKGLEEEYPNFTIDSGVSSELINALCTEIKRNMYAYDENSKVFDSVITQSSKNYAPIVFYKLHGHFYLIDDPTVMRSVAESNKTKGTKILSVSLTDEIKQTEKTVYIIDKFDVEKAAELCEGVHLIRQPNLDKEIIEFIKIHKNVPFTRTTKSNVTEIQFEVGLQHCEHKKDRKYVCVCVDATHAEVYTHAQLKHVAELNNITYTNEGIGSVILKILENSNRNERTYLTDDEKAKFLLTHNHTCAVCKIKCDYLEIDHILPLAAGGTNQIHNLQPLCSHCHKQKTTDEKTTGTYAHLKDPEISVFNKIAIDNVINNDIKTWQFVEKTGEQANADIPVFKTDMRKCRRNIAYHSTFEYPVFSVMDNPEPFSGILQCGLFYVITKNSFPFRGCGWYSQPLVEYGLDNKHFEKSDITLQFIPSNKLPADHFKPQIDTLLTAFASEPTLQKLAVNSRIGILGRTKQSAARTKFTMCKYEAAELFGSGKNDEYTQSTLFIRSIDLTDNEKLYQAVFNEPVQMEGIKYPLYKQILEIEAIELHTLETAIRKHGGIVLDRNTDAIRYASPKEIILTDEWTPGNPKYQSEQPNELKCEVKPHLVRINNLDHTKFALKWNIQYDYPGTVQEEAKRIIDTNTSIHIDGRAGTGKTFLINAIRNELKSREVKFAAFSPTNKGARLVGGQTIHSVYFKYKTSKKKMFSIMQPLQYIFIDEVSMMIADFYQLFSLIKRTFSHIKFIIAGDFGQLPPVCDSWTGDYQNSPALHSLCDGQRIQLTKCRRADDELFKLCSDVHSIDTTQFAYTEHTYLNLAYTHSTRIRVNDECMTRFIAEFKPERVIKITRDPLNPKTQDVSLAIGIPVIAHTTNKKLKFLNSQTFTITHITDSHIQLKNDVDEVLIKLDEFHKYFYPAFCMTIHASQGETFKNKYTIYDWNFQYVCEKAKYVALSRGTNIKNIQIR